MRRHSSKSWMFSLGGFCYFLIFPPLLKLLPLLIWMLLGFIIVGFQPLLLPLWLVSSLMKFPFNQKKKIIIYHQSQQIRYVVNKKIWVLKLIVPDLFPVRCWIKSLRKNEREWGVMKH